MSKSDLVSKGSGVGSADTMEQLKKNFDKFDKNGSETVSLEEVQRIMAEIAKHGDGHIDIKQLAEIINGGSTKKLRDAFDLYNLAKNGLISTSELHEVLKRLEKKYSKMISSVDSLKDCAKMISSVDADGDDHVNFADLGATGTMEELKKNFDKFDKNGSKTVSLEEVQRIMAEIAKHGDGHIDIKKLAEIINGGSTKKLRDAFDLYNLAKNGLISTSELHEVLKRLEKKYSLKDRAKMISSVHADVDDHVNFSDLGAAGTMEELKKNFDKFDKNGSETVSLEEVQRTEFKKMMTRESPRKEVMSEKVGAKETGRFCVLNQGFGMTVRSEDRDGGACFACERKGSEEKGLCGGLGLMEDSDTKGNMEELGQTLGSKFLLTDKEKEGVVIEKKDVEEALVGFPYILLADVLTERTVNAEAFINRFTSMWRGTEGVSIRDLGDRRFLIGFVAKRDMQRVIESDFPLTFRKDFVLVADCTNRRDARWEEMSMGEMWVQIHKVPPLSMTAAVATAIGGGIGMVITVDKSASRECVGRFLRVRIQLNLREPLMRGMVVTFPDEGRVWVQFKYEGLPNYCFYCGKLGHVSRVCKAQVKRGVQGMEEGEELLKQGRSLPYEGLEARMDLRGNVLRSPSGKSKSPSMGEGSGRTVESRRDGDMHHEGMQGVWRTGARGGRVEQASRRVGNNRDGDVEDTGSSPGEKDKYDCPVREGSGIRGDLRNQRRVAEEEARKDAGLIGRGGIVAPGIENVVLVESVEPVRTMEGGADGNQRGLQVDLNIPVGMEGGADGNQRGLQVDLNVPVENQRGLQVDLNVRVGMEEGLDGNQRGLQVDLNVPVGMEDEGHSVMMQQLSGMDGVTQVNDVVHEEAEGKVYNGTQDSDSLELGPIIVRSRESRRRKRRIEEVEGTGRDVSVTSTGNKRALIFTVAEETSREGSSRSP